MLTPAFITQHIDTILTLCAEKHQNIIEKGRSDKLEINDQVEKFILDKVLPECVNQFIYEMLAVKVKKNGVSLNKEIGLWATPATWMQKYPKSQLDSLPSQYFGQLLGRGWTVVPNFLSSSANLTKELLMLERDGKF